MGKEGCGIKEREDAKKRGLKEGGGQRNRVAPEKGGGERL